MSNPSVCYLVRTQIYGVVFAIEDNIGEAIHIHYGKARIDMTISEFLSFSDCVIEAARKLFMLRGLNWDLLDIESVKEEWAKYYSKISSIEEDSVTLNSLFMKESYIQQRSIKRIIELKDSGYIPYFKGISQDQEYYDEPGIYEPSRGEKARKIEKMIRGNGYPYDKKRILIDQDGYILDGLKRASCLYYLKGGNLTIPVIKMNIEWDESIDIRRARSEQEIEELGDDNAEAVKTPCKQPEAPEIAFDAILHDISDLNIDYMVVRGDGSNGFGIAAFILVKKECYESVKEKLKNYNETHSLFKDYYFAYAMNKPLVYTTEIGIVLVHDKYFVKSKFIKCTTIPLDKAIQSWIWSNREFKEENGIWEENALCRLVLTIIHCVLEGNELSDYSISKLKNNISYLFSEEIKEAMESVFFKYNDHLLDCLLNEKYYDAVNDYVSFSEY